MEIKNKNLKYKTKYEKLKQIGGFSNTSTTEYKDRISGLTHLLRNDVINNVRTNIFNMGSDLDIAKNQISIKYGDNIPIEYHPKIRSEEACLKSTLRIIDLAKKCNSRLHVFHLSTKSESKLFEILPLENKNVTSEVCIHHLSFNDLDYKEKGALIKWNPAVKSQLDQDALWDALNSGRIDIVATDHAPHTLKEKQNNYLNCPSGGPLVQHSLIVMYEHYLNKKITLQKIVEKMCNNPAKIFKINKRGYIREGYYADLVILDPNKKQTIGSNNILYKCGWSPFEGKTFNSVITHTFVNGHLAFNNGNLDDSKLGMKINFNNEN